MSIFLVLDVLLLLLIALFMPIGFWRGPVKELLVTLGILFGVVLADFWARPWGRDLSTYTDFTAGAGAFVVGMFFLIAATFVLGYGAGAALGPSLHSTQARLLGAGIAALNGTLLLSFSLQYVRLYLLSDANEESLEDSFVSRFLLNEIGWVLMLAAVVGVPLLLYILISGRRAYEVIWEDEEEGVAPGWERVRVADAAASIRPPRVPGAPRREEGPAYKRERADASARAAAETRALVVTRQREATEAVSHDEAAARMGDTDPHLVLPSSPAAEAAPVDEEEREDLPPGFERCVTCHAVLSPELTICPNCGTVR